MTHHMSLPLAFDFALEIISSSDTPLVMLDGNLTVIAASQSFCLAFQVDPTTVRGKSMSHIGSGEWNIPQLDSLLKATAAGFASVVGYEMTLELQDKTCRNVVIKSHKVDHPDGANIRLLVSVSDVTEQRASEKIKDDLLREKAMLLKELQHRVANSLQIIASVLMQSARKVQSKESRAHIYDAHHRVMSIASLQKQLSISGLDDVSLNSYLSELCRSIGASMIHDPKLISLSVVVDDSQVVSDMSISLGLIVTELVINALKHAFPEDRPGKIVVSYQADGEDWTLFVGDDGIGMPKDVETKAGLGTSIVQALAAQLEAEIEIADTSPGTRVALTHRSGGDAYMSKPDAV